MAELSFLGFKYKQNPTSPQLFSFVGPAATLKKICGVARKQDSITNYQRALDEKRVKKEVTPFFTNPENCSPTALVISLHESNACKVRFEKVEGDVPSIPYCTLEKLVIEFEETDSMSKDQVISLMKTFLDNRLKDDVEEGAGQTEENNPSAGAQDGEIDDTGDDSADDDTDVEIEIGTSKMRELRVILDSPDQVNDEMVEAFRDMLKPALIIDGQHRLEGASSVEEDIPFLVCAVIEPDWKEEVFQFTVINSKACKIPAPFITSLAGMSLTGKELDSLRERLSNAGVHLWEVEVMQRMGGDPESPFFNMIDFKDGVKNGASSDGRTGLGYGTMKNVGRTWYDAPQEAKCLTDIIKKIYETDDRKLNIKQARGILQNEKLWWFKLYVIFWKAVKEKAEEWNIWDLNSGELMKAVVLQQLQATFFVKLNSNLKYVIKDVESDSQEVRESGILAQYTTYAKDFVDKFKKQHFTKPFKCSLNQTDGKKILADYFSKIYDGNSVTNHPVFKESSH